MRVFGFFIFNFCLIILFGQSVFGQVGSERTNWVFGKNASLTFNQSGISAVNTHPLDAYQGSACYSNKAGKLILATNGNAVYGPNNNLIGQILGGDPKDGSTGQIIIPKDEEERLFYIFIVDPTGDVRYAEVDLNANGGNGILITNSEILLSGSCVDFTAVKHCFTDGYWLICSNRSNDFYTFLVNQNSISKPVISTVGSVRSTTGDIVSNHAGDKLAVSNYTQNWVELYDFDKRCGSISNPKRIDAPTSPDLDHPDGLTFSPDDKSLFVAWSYQNSMLVQYDLKNWGSYYNCYSSSENINDIMIGIDGHLYLNVHENGIPSRRIHQMRNPNIIAGGGTRVREDIATLPFATNGAFEFPNFLSNTTGGGCIGVQPTMEVKVVASKNRCTNEQISFDAYLAALVCDSIRWNFDDPGSPDNFSNEPKIRRYFNEERTYHVECYLFYCQFADTVRFDLDMAYPPEFDLGRDTFVCNGSQIEIGVGNDLDSVIWSDGFNGFFRNVSAGSYGAIGYRKKCMVFDKILIGNYPDIWTELGSEYSICDLENETVLLDAGKGFKRYKWTPTGDTTQWIVVKELGEYIVIVDAYTGCFGEGKTVVKRICDLSVYVPNAFSPNGDGLNETFGAVGEYITFQSLKIYNLWGELIYEGAGDQAVWDGQNAPNGTYTYQLEVHGFQHKIPVRKQLSGTVLLSK